MATQEMPVQSRPVKDRSGDIELVRRFNDGDESAFTQIVEMNHGRLTSVVRGHTKDESDVEEIVQDTFVRAYGYLAVFRCDCAIFTWLCKISMNLARNRYWYNFRRKKGELFSLDAPCDSSGGAPLINCVMDDGPSPAHQAGMVEFARIVDECMGCLSKEHRKILILRNVRRLSYVEIAAKLGILEGTVKSRIARARQDLRAALMKTCPEFDRVETILHELTRNR